jgi:hypothetical protein
MAVHLAVQRVGVAGDGGDMHAALAQHGGHAVAHQRGIVGDDHPQGAAGERIPPRGHDDMAPAQAAQLELAIVLEPQLLPEVLVRLGELPDHAGDQDLAPARQVGDSRRLDHGTSVEVTSSRTAGSPVCIPIRTRTSGAPSSGSARWTSIAQRNAARALGKASRCPSPSALTSVSPCLAMLALNTRRRRYALPVRRSGSAAMGRSRAAHR